MFRNGFDWFYDNYHLPSYCGYPAYNLAYHVVSCSVGVSPRTCIHTGTGLYAVDEGLRGHNAIQSVAIG